MSSLANFPKALAIFQDKKLAKFFFSILADIRGFIDKGF